MSDQKGESNVDKHDSSVIANALKDIADSSKETNERIVRQETNYEHLAKSIESIALSNKDLNQNMSDLTILVKEIFLSNQNLEKKTVSSIDEVKDKVKVMNTEFKDKFHSIEEDIANLQDKVCGIEVKNAKEDGKEEANALTRAWWRTNWFKILLTFLIAVPFIDFLYEKLKPIAGG